MAKRPTLGTYAQPVSQMVVPIQEQAQPLNEQAIRETYAFADAFSDLSQSMVELASTIKTQQNKDYFAEGRRLVEQNRKTYRDLISSGQISPSENPWLALGAQQASGVLEAEKAANEFRMEYERQVTNNPDLLMDNGFFDALAFSYADRKRQEFGTAGLLSDSFFNDFNKTVTEVGAEHAKSVGKYRIQKINDSLRIKVAQTIDPEAIRGRFVKNLKALGLEGPAYDLQGNEVVQRYMKIVFEDQTVDVPMLVPSLTLDEVEQIVYYPERPLAPAVRKKIIDSAVSDLSKGAVPEGAAEAQAFAELQTYMDDQGKNMGLPRIANMSVASSLIEMMQTSNDPDLAERALSSLRAGTGRLIDTNDVQVMLLDAKPKIDENRFRIVKARDNQIVALALDEAFNAAYSSNATFDAAYDQFQQRLAATSTLSAEDYGKARDRLNEQVSKGQKLYQEGYDRQTIRMVVSEVQEEFNKTASEGGPILRWDYVLQKYNETLRRRGIEPGTQGANEARKAVLTAFNDYFARSEQGLIDDIRKKMGTQSTSLYPEPGDTALVKQMKDQYRLNHKLNILIAAQNFNMEDRLAEIRSIAANGISVDVEMGVRPELADLVRIYQSIEGGRAPIDLILETQGERGRRTLSFLKDVSSRYSMGRDINEAVRDSAQLFNLGQSAKAIELTDINANSAQLAEASSALSSARSGLRNQYWVFDLGFFDKAINPDAEPVITSYFVRAYMDTLNKTMGDHKAAVDAASSFVANELTIVNGSVIPKSILKQNNIASGSYLMHFARVESGGRTDTAPVIVGFDSNAEPIFALRTKDGRSVRDRYYTIADMTSEDIRPKVVESMAKELKESKLTPAEKERFKREAPILPRGIR